MRKIITTTFLTLDGVMQAPGGPDEDTAGGFSKGGWSVNYWDNSMNDFMAKLMSDPFELLLGSKTYDIFAAYWPNATSDQIVAQKFNNTKKYVVSHHPKHLSWENSYLISGDVRRNLKDLKTKDEPDLWVHGSGNLIQTLLASNLIDLMYIWTFPVTVGNGKRLFSEGTKDQGFKLVDSKVSASGVIIATYVPEGELITGSFA